MTDAIKAFVKAQSEMGKALKTNTAKGEKYSYKYTDLASVQEACFPALHENGFVVMQPLGWDDHGEYVETKFLHETGAEFLTRIYLKVGKPDMQGYGSAITYARRYGLMSLAGIAPEDDDGNAASKYPPRSAPQRAPEPPHDPQTGEVYSERNPPPAGDIDWTAEPGLHVAAPIELTDDEMQLSAPLQGFLLEVRKIAGRGASREKIAETYAAEVIRRLRNYKPTAQGKRFFGHFCEIHEAAIAKLRDDLQGDVRQAMAETRARLEAGQYPTAGRNDPIVLGDVQVTDDAGRPI